MEPLLIAIAPKRDLIDPLLEQLQRRGLGNHFLQWRSEPLEALMIGRAPQTAVLVIPMLTGTELVVIMDLLAAKPKTSVVVVAGGVTDEPDTDWLFAEVLPRTAIVDLRGSVEMGDRSFERALRQLSGSFWSEVAELAAEGASGIHCLTDDGMLVEAALPSPASDRGAFGVSGLCGVRSQIDERPLDGLGRIR